MVSIGTAVLAALLAAAAAAEADPVLLSVNGAKIRRSEVHRRLWRRHGREAVEVFIDELLWRQAARRLGLSPDPLEVDARVAELRKDFRDEATFLARLKAMGSTLEELRGRLGEELVREKVVRARRDVAPTAAEVRGYFEKNREALGTPERVRLRYLLVRTEPEAKAALVAARAGADFAKLASELSSDPSKERGGDLGLVPRGRLQPEAEALAFSLQPGESGMVRTAKGWHVFQVVERKAPEPAEFDEAEPAAREAVAQRKLEEAFPLVLKGLREEAKIERFEPPAAGR